MHAARVRVGHRHTIGIMRRPPRIAYTILANPFMHERNSPKAPLMNGPVPAADVLRIHLAALSERQTALIAEVLILVPTDRSLREVPGARNTTLPLGVHLPCPQRLIAVANNSLGSYGMYLHAFATARDERFDYFVFCEDDYIPVLDHFDAALVRIYEATFADGRPGVLAGVLQGRPAEPASPRGLHLETSHIMSTRSLQHLFWYIYDSVGWTGSTTERMAYLLRAAGRPKNKYVFGAAQEGFGALMTDAGIEMRDWSRAYRSPYWDHERLIDWSGAASNFSLASSRHLLFAPVQMQFVTSTWSCCGGSEAACSSACEMPGAQNSPADRTSIGEDCCHSRAVATARAETADSVVASHELRWLRARLSIPADAAQVEGARLSVGASEWRPQSAVGGTKRTNKTFTFNCEGVPSDTEDVSPMRSPVAVHSRMLSRIRGRHVVELGTRRGDGMACFARVAATASAVEPDERNCARLRDRAASLWRQGGRGFQVFCEGYQQLQIPPEAEVFTWWQDEPDLSNFAVLGWLREAYAARRLREDAEAIVLFDLAYTGDVASWANLTADGVPWTWTELVTFDESMGCREKLQRPNLCRRAVGTFRVASVLVSALRASRTPGARRTRKSRPTAVPQAEGAAAPPMLAPAEGAVAEAAASEGVGTAS